MNKIPIVFTFDEFCLLPASIAISSLIENKNSDTEYDIFVLHNGIKTSLQEKFKSITDITWIKINDSEFKDFTTNSHWNETVYYRLLIPKLLPQYDKIIYSDIDVLFNGDLSKVYKTDIEDYYWAGVIAEHNNPNSECHKYFPENKNEYIYMSGFMLINSKKMISDNILEKLFKNAKTFKDRLKFFDLDLLNITCDKIKGLPFEYCVLENIYSENEVQYAKEYTWLSKFYTDEILKSAKNNPIIIHYAGKTPKIWLRPISEIPNYYMQYVEKSPFYDKDCTFTFSKYLIYYLLKIIRVFAFNKKLSNKLNRKIKQLKLIKGNMDFLYISKDTKCLMICPHPDDEIIGAGGLLLEYSKNFDVVCISSSGCNKNIQIAKEKSNIRISEFKKVMSEAGIANSHIYETYGIPFFEKQILNHFNDYIKDTNFSSYDYIFIPHINDKHPEHRFISRELIPKLLKKCHVKNTKTKIVFYEVWAPIPTPNYYFAMSEELMNKKMDVLNLYKSQISTKFDYPRWTRHLNGYRSINVKTSKFAEAYQVISLKSYYKIVKRK